MKLIDDKGRLFSKFNIIDLLIVFIVIAALFGINYKLGFLKKVSTEQQEIQKHTIKFWVKDIAPYTADAIQVNDIVKELRSNSDIGKIISNEIMPTMKTASDVNGKWVLSEVPERNDVIITMETLNDSAIENIKLGSIDAKVGASITLKGPKFQVNSYIIGVDSDEK